LAFGAPDKQSTCGMGVGGRFTIKGGAGEEKSSPGNSTFLPLRRRDISHFPKVQ